jgi:C1A family cysteine protease
MGNIALSPAGRRYGAYKSTPDTRDYNFHRFNAFLAAAGTPPPSILPSNTNNRAYCGPVRDQSTEGSCTGHAGYAERMFLANRYQNFNNSEQLSPAFIYYFARQIDGSLSEGDCGSTGRTICMVLNQFGAAPESDDPYVAGQFNNAPSNQAVVDALKFKAGAYHRLLNVSSMRSCLASEYVFKVGFVVYSSFEEDQIANTGLMPVPNKATEQVLGGHEVCFIDYDDDVRCPGARSSGAFLVQNSWGSSWGKDGFFYFPYQCIADSDIFMDAFISHLGKPW